MTPHEAQVLRIIRMFEPLTTLLRRSYVRPNFVSIGLIFMYTYHRSTFPVPVKCPRISNRIRATQRLKIADRALPFDRISTTYLCTCQCAANAAYQIFLCTLIPAGHRDQAHPGRRPLASRRSERCGCTDIQDVCRYTSAMLRQCIVPQYQVPPTTYKRSYLALQR